MLTGQPIICFSSIDWDFLWQGHQEIMSTLARQGHRVLFVENTGVRAPTFRDLPRLRQRIRNWRRGIKGFRKERDDVVVYAPVILPFPYAHAARWLNRFLMLTAIRRWMRASGFQRPMVWTFLPTPLILDLIHALDPRLLIYYCADDIASSSQQAKKIRRSETRLFREADLVFVTADNLRQKARQWNEHVHLFPFGVNYRAFEQVRRSPDAVPEDLGRLPRPIVGYVGGIHQWVDQDLLVQAAQRLPEASFVLVGPAQTEVSKLARCPNVHLLGFRNHADLPRYLKGFTVGLVPYRLSIYTANVYPTKLNEYLSMGIPVVTTDLPEIRRFNTEHGSVVAVAQDADEFASQVQDAITRQSPAEVERRIGVARQNSWEARIASMSDLIEQAFARRQALESRWEDSLYRLYRSARRRIVRTAVAAGLASLVLFHTPFVWWLGAPLRLAAPPANADCIVVFAGGVGESGKAGQGYEERVQHAVALWKAGYAPRLLFVSGSVYALQETQVMKALATELGLPPGALLLDDRPANTYEMVQVTADRMRQVGRSSLLLVSSPYHMRRASLVFRKQAPLLRVIPTPIPHSVFYDDREGIVLRHYQGILHEYLGLLSYWWKGYL